VTLTRRGRWPDLVMLVDDHGYESREVENSRGRDANTVTVRNQGSTSFQPLEPRLDLFNHSPTGFEWAWRLGSGEMRRAIVADTLDTVILTRRGRCRERTAAPVNRELSTGHVDPACRRSHRRQAHHPGAAGEPP